MAVRFHLSYTSPIKQKKKIASKDAIFNNNYSLFNIHYSLKKLLFSEELFNIRTLQSLLFWDKG